MNERDDIKDILNYNDKCLLILYSYHNKNSREYKRLCRIYGEDISDEYSIRIYLLSCKYLHCEKIHENGKVISCTPIEITKLGINALKKHRFFSETKKRRSEERERLVRIISLIISSIGGILGFISFFK